MLNGARYSIFGRETCATTSKTHLQGYIEFQKPKRLAGVKSYLNDPTAHCEPRKGPREAARDYCKKEGDFVEQGEWIEGPGSR